LDAKVGIWITPNPRQEHVRAINFLNEVVPEDTNFYLLKIQALKIDNSEIAPLLTVVAGPNPELTASGKIKKEIAEIEKQRYKFFEELLNLSNSKTNLFQNVSPLGYQSWIWAGAGKAGLAWMYAVLKNRSKAEFYLGSSDGDKNKEWYHILYSKKSEIEQEFGEPLEWDFKEGRKQHYVRSWSKFGGIQNIEEWPKIQNDLIERMLKLEKVLSKHIKEFK
jgi:hypothetical protein